MNVSSFSLSAPISQIFSANDKKAKLNFDSALATETNYPTQKPQVSDNAIESYTPAKSSYEQFIFAPNLGVLFSAYLDRQKLDQNVDGKKKELTERLTNSGMDRSVAKNYAENGIEFYKQMMEAQFRSKINGEVQKQDELKQMLGQSTTPNPYMQMTGSLINIYS